MTIRLASFLLLAVSASVASAFTYTVHNNCNQPIDVHLGWKRLLENKTVAAGATFQFGADTDFFTVSSPSNAAKYEGQPWRFGPHALFRSYSHYTIVKDPNPNNANVGISITPDKPLNNGLCRAAVCETGLCSGAYLGEFPFYLDPIQSPTPPDYRCPNGNYRITFCPGSGKVLQPPGTQLNIKANSKKCLDVKSAVFADGTPVQIYDCNKSNAQKWIVRQGSTQVKVHGKDFCLDAGSNPGDGTKLKISKCNANAAGQKWYYTGMYTQERQLKWAGDNRSKALCLDLTKGSQANSNVVQTWHCGGDLNPNQLWTTVN